jgi:hypothetical protein
MSTRHETRFSWTQPICAPCYVKRHPGREPVHVLQTPSEVCCDCGAATRDGIYVRVDPTSVMYPTRRKS